MDIQVRLVIHNLFCSCNIEVQFDITTWTRVSVDVIYRTPIVASHAPIIASHTYWSLYNQLLLQNKPMSALSMFALSFREIPFLKKHLPQYDYLFQHATLFVSLHATWAQNIDFTRAVEGPVLSQRELLRNASHLDLYHVECRVKICILLLCLLVFDSLIAWW